MPASAARLPLVVFLACALPRVAALFFFPPDTSVYYYWEASSAFKASMHFVEPVYPALLAALRILTGDRLTLVLLGQIAIAAAAGVPLYRLTDDLAGRRAAIVATALYAWDPYLVRQSVSFVEITLCSALLIAAARVHIRSHSIRDACLTGILLGLAALTRFSLLPIAAGTVALLLWQRLPRHAAAAAAGAGAPIALWMIWSSMTTGGLLPARVGINLFVSTSEYAAQVEPLHNVDYLVPYAYDSIASEVPDFAANEMQLERARDAILFRRALLFARAHPLETLKLKLRNLAFTAAPILLPLDPKPRGATATIKDGVVQFSGGDKRPLLDHVIYTASRTILLIGTAIGLLRRRRRHGGEAMLWVIVASIVAVSTIFFPTSRLLAPMAFVMMVYTGIGVRGPGVRSPGSGVRDPGSGL